MLDAFGLTPLLLAQSTLNGLDQTLLGVVGLVDVLAVVQLAKLEVDLHHVFLDARAVPVGNVLVAEVVDPALGVAAHDLEHVASHGVVALLLEQGGNGVLDAHDLIAELVHAHLGGQLQGLAEVLVGLPDVEVLASAVEDGAAQLLRDGLGKVVVGFLDDIAIVPGDVVCGPAGHGDDAAAVSLRAAEAGRYLRDEGEGECDGAPAELVAELVAHRRRVAAGEMLAGGLPCAGCGDGDGCLRGLAGRSGGGAQHRSRQHGV